MEVVETKKPKVLIIDDEEQIRNLLIDVLCDSYQCSDAGSAEEALTALANTSFEAPVVGNGFAYGPTGANVGWTFASAGVQGNGSAWGAAVAPNGSQTAFIQQTGTISQTFNLDPGNYTLALQVARRNYSVPAGSAQPIRVTIDGAQIGSLISPPSTAFTPITIPFSIATSGMHTLVFTGTDASGDKSTFIDLVTIGP